MLSVPQEQGQWRLLTFDLASFSRRGNAWACENPASRATGHVPLLKTNKRPSLHAFFVCPLSTSPFVIFFMLCTGAVVTKVARGGPFPDIRLASSSPFCKLLKVINLKETVITVRGTLSEWACPSPLAPPKIS